MKFPKRLQTIFSKLYIQNDHSVIMNLNYTSKIKINSLGRNLDSNPSDLVCPVQLSELKLYLIDLKRQKSPDVDNFTNEHILHGGPALFQSLKKLYCMLSYRLDS